MKNKNLMEDKMKKIQIFLLILLVHTLLFGVQYVEVDARCNVDATGVAQIANGNLQIIGELSLFYAVPLGPNSTTTIEFTIPDGINLTTLNTYYTRVYGYDENIPNGWGYTTWVQGGYSGSGTLLAPYVHTGLIELEIERHDLRIYTVANLDRESTCTIYNEDDVQLATDTETFVKGSRTFYFYDLGSTTPPNDGWYAVIEEESDTGETITSNAQTLQSSGTNPVYYLNWPNSQFTFEDKPFHSKWNWESFPKLSFNTTSNNYEDDFVPELEDNITPGEFDWLNLDDIQSGSPNLTYDEDEWEPESYDLRSSDAVKISLDSSSARYFDADGTRLSASTSISLNAGWNWIGYWLPYALMSDVAFGEDNWDEVNIIQAEDWYYDDLSVPDKGIGDPEPQTPQPKPMYYGEGYLVKMHSAVTLTWDPDDSREDREFVNFDRPEPQYFDFETKSDYEVIDIVDVPQNISEIGVFLDDVCVGAVVVQDPSVQILLYTDDISREPSPFNFQVITGRGGSSAIKNYEVYNMDSGNFEPGVVVSQMQGYSIVRLGEEDEPQNDMSIVDQLVLQANYPNPFNPVTNISFSLPSDQDIELIVYNTKGQIVRKLIQGQYPSGTHSVTWDGKGESGNIVGSGLYFYKLITTDQEISKKMLLLK